MIPFHASHNFPAKAEMLSISHGHANRDRIVMTGLAVPGGVILTVKIDDIHDAQESADTICLAGVSMDEARDVTFREIDAIWQGNRQGHNRVVHYAAPMPGGLLIAVKQDRLHADGGMGLCWAPGLGLDDNDEIVGEITGGTTSTPPTPPNVVVITNGSLPGTTPPDTTCLIIDVDTSGGDVDLTGWYPTGLPAGACVRVRNATGGGTITYTDGVTTYDFADNQGEMVCFISDGTSLQIT